MSEMVFLRRNLPLVERFPQYQQKDPMILMASIKLGKNCRKCLLKKEFIFSGMISSVLTER